MISFQTFNGPFYFLRQYYFVYFTNSKGFYIKKYKFENFLSFGMEHGFATSNNVFSLWGYSIWIMPAHH